MKKLKNALGIMLIVLGVVLLAVLHVLHLTFINMLLVVPLLLIITGVVVHITVQKRQSKY